MLPRMMPSLSVAVPAALSAAISAAMALSAGEAAAQPAPFTLTILHINDHHSNLAPGSFPFDASALGLSATPDRGRIAVSHGGFPMIATAFAEIAAESSAVLKLHAGDAITGSLYHTLYKGVADAAMMNAICFDAFAVGNHEFDEGDAGLAAFLDALGQGDCGTAVLGANIVPGETSPVRDRIAPRAVFERGGERIGVVGLVIAGKTRNSSQPDETTEFLDEAQTAQAQIDALRAEGVERIVLLTHVQYRNDLALAASLTGVDVIVGGDSHSLLGDARLGGLGFRPEGDYPTIVTNADGDRVCVVHAFEYAKLLGHLTVTFDEAGRVVSCDGSPIIPVDGQTFRYTVGDERRTLDAADAQKVRDALSAFPEIRFTMPDETSAALLAGFDNRVGELTQAVIGEAADKLCLVRVPGENRAAPLCDPSETWLRGSDISNIVARAFLEREPSADIAIQNAGGVRVSLPAGPVTVGDVYRVLPFANTMTILTITGEEIVAVLEDAIANFADDGGSNGSYPYAAGLRYHVDLSQPRGSRISRVEINPRVAGEWRPIGMSETYRVVTNSFIASGRDGYATFRKVSDDGRAEAMFSEYAQSFIAYIEALSAADLPLARLPAEQYSTQGFVDAKGCDHALRTDCGG